MAKEEGKIASQPLAETSSDVKTEAPLITDADIDALDLNDAPQVTQDTIKELLKSIQDKQERFRLVSVLVVLGIIAVAIPAVAAVLDSRGFESVYIGAWLINAAAIARTLGVSLSLKEGLKKEGTDVDTGSILAILVILIAVLFQIDQDSKSGQIIHAAFLAPAIFLAATTLPKNISGKAAGATMGAYTGYTGYLFMEASKVSLPPGTTGFYAAIAIATGLLGAGAVFDRAQKEKNVGDLLRVNEGEQKEKQKSDRLFRLEQKARKTAQRALQETETAYAVRDEVMSQTDHELRRDLTALSSATETLKNILSQEQLTNGEPITELLNAQMVTLKNLHLRVHNRMSLTATETGKDQVLIGPVKKRDLRQLAQTMEVLVKAMRPNCKFTILIDAVPKDFVFSTDSLKLKTIFDNLVHNAAKYMGKPEDGRAEEISVEFQVTEGGGCRIKIKDTGIGIAEEDQDKIWEKGYRTEQGIQTVSEGSRGLGLTLVKQSVEQLGGTIEVKSEVGVGSEFAFTLPNKQI